MTGLVTGVVLGAALWAVVIAWIVPLVGWLAVAVTLAGLTALVCWDIAHAPVMDVES